VTRAETRLDRRAKTSTSIHALNGDRELGRLGQARYFALNWLNNQLPEWNVDAHLTVRDFRCADLASYAPRLPTGASPSRKLSDLFWMTLPWVDIEQELGSIHVLDVGCGRGGYGQRLLAWSDHRIASYTGTDIQPHGGWTDLTANDPRLRFIRADAAALADVIPADTNFIMSQSAIEHMDDDLAFFAQIHAHTVRLGRSVIQVHLCPSRACLGLYLLHGVRQYTPRTLSAITRVFPDARSFLYRLGGRACNRLHLRFITRPLLFGGTTDLRQVRADEYERRALAAIEADMRQPQPSPAFYALVIHSAPHHSLF
jgi:SAM-dependent methyltransferase